MEQHLSHLGQAIGFPIPDWKPAEILSEEPMVGLFCRVVRLDAASHAASLYAANAMDSAGKMWTYLPYGPFASEDAYQTWVDEMSRRKDPRFHAIIDRATHRAIGVASYLRIDASNGSVEVGHIGFSPLLQRSPAATEAMFLMMQRAFASGYRRYEWKCDSLNTPSMAAARRLGFSLEGVFRQAAVVKGRNRDTAWFSVIDKEWPALQEAFLRWLDKDNFDEEGMQRARLSELTAAALAGFRSGDMPSD